ncbi:hypothetical protein HYFRA_00005368 [Hymenoscyphus fraxineus]|uniref:Uncharacterized protein n=1 Tax=Hymenoscyphus fraxineus TaxID=746836 RepID=A0A9N9LD35_9HELO|nr:hypothetical protein HYFRA_00005368 [Hymenoscyphus fraxineus]
MHLQIILLAIASLFLAIIEGASPPSSVSVFYPLRDFDDVNQLQPAVIAVFPLNKQTIITNAFVQNVTNGNVRFVDAFPKKENREARCTFWADVNGESVVATNVGGDGVIIAEGTTIAMVFCSGTTSFPTEPQLSNRKRRAKF